MNPTGTVLNILGLNGTPFLQQPTDHNWIERESIGVDGNGVSVLVAPRQYQMKWDFLDTDAFQDINNQYIAQGITGSVVVTLPTWVGNPYQFTNYSGCIIRELAFDNYFQNWYSNVRLLIVRINT